MKTTFVVVVVLASLVAAAPAAWGQGVGGASPTETTYVIQHTYWVPEAPTKWGTHIGSLQDRIEVELDPAGPFWLKHIQRDGPPASMWSEHHIFLQEHLVISGGQSWSGWIEQIDAPGFEWRSDIMPDAPVPGVLVNGSSPAGLSIEIEGETLRFSFDPLPPGTEIDVTSRLLYTGTNLVDSFDVRQFATPEPTTLLSLLVLASLTRRR